MSSAKITRLTLWFLKRKIGQRQLFLQIVGKGSLRGPGVPGDLYGLVRLVEVIRVVGWSGWFR